MHGDDLDCYFWLELNRVQVGILIFDMTCRINSVVNIQHNKITPAWVRNVAYLIAIASNLLNIPVLEQSKFPFSLLRANAYNVNCKRQTGRSPSGLVARQGVRSRTFTHDLSSASFILLFVEANEWNIRRCYAREYPFLPSRRRIRGIWCKYPCWWCSPRWRYYLF